MAEVLTTPDEIHHHATDPVDADHHDGLESRADDLMYLVGSTMEHPGAVALEPDSDPKTASIFYFGKMPGEEYTIVHGKNAEGAAVRGLPPVVYDAVGTNSLHNGQLNGPQRFGGRAYVDRGEFVVVNVEPQASDDDPWTLLATHTPGTYGEAGRVIGMKGRVDPGAVIDTFRAEMPEQFVEFATEVYDAAQTLKVSDYELNIRKDGVSFKRPDDEQAVDIKSDDVAVFTRRMEYHAEVQASSEPRPAPPAVHAARAAVFRAHDPGAATEPTGPEPVSPVATEPSRTSPSASVPSRTTGEHAGAISPTVIPPMSESLKQPASKTRLARAVEAVGPRAAEARQKLGSALRAMRDSTSVEWGPTLTEAGVDARIAKRRLAKLEAKENSAAAGEQTPSRLASVLETARTSLAALKVEYRSGNISMQKVSNLAAAGIKRATEAAANTRERLNNVELDDRRVRILSRALGGAALAGGATLAAVVVVANYRAGNFDAIGDFFDQLGNTDPMTGGGEVADAASAPAPVTAPEDGLFDLADGSAPVVPETPAPPAEDVPAVTEPAAPATPESALPQDTAVETAAQTPPEPHHEVQPDVHEVTLRDYDSATGDGTIEGQTMQEIEDMGISTDGLDEQELETAINRIRTETLELNGISAGDAQLMHEGDTFTMLDHLRIEEILAEAKKNK